MTSSPGKTPEECIHAAKQAIRKGEYLEAYEHLGHIDMHGPHAKEVKELREEIRETEAADLKDAARAPWAGFGVGVVLYLILTIRSPAQWTKPVWMVLAFLIVPAIAGYFTAWYYGFRCQRRERFRPSAMAGGFSMVIYAIIGLIIARCKIAEDPGVDSGGVLLASCVVTVVYGVIAAVVAGVVGAARPYTELPDDDQPESWWGKK
jgi:hypothetical protein